MATYIENDMQNTLIDIQNGNAVTTASNRHRVPRTTLRDRFNGARSCRHAHENK